MKKYVLSFFYYFLCYLFFVQFKMYLLLMLLHLN